MTWKVAIGCLTLTAAAGLAQTARISGRVQDSSGNAVSGVQLIVQSTTVPTDGPPEIKLATPTSSGDYLADGLAGGNYQICVDTGSSGYLNPCEWGHTPIVVDATAGQGDTVANLTLEAGATLTVRVSDPLDLKPDIMAGDVDTFVRPVVWTADGHCRASRWVRTTKRAHFFEIVVPYDTDFSLAVDAQNLTVNDESGKAITSQSRLAGRLARSDSSRLFLFSIAKR